MITKKEIKYLSSLKQKKNRYLNHEILIEGSKLILDAFKHKQKIKKIIYSNKNNKFNEIRKYAKKNNVIMELCSNKDAERISDTKNSQQMFGLLNFNSPLKINNNININDNIIIIDGISDPGNMGAMIRTADWFGIDTIYISENSVDVFNPKVVQSSMGSLSRVSVCQVSLLDVVRKMKSKNIICYSASISGQSIYEIKPPDQFAIIFGSESHGISDSILRYINNPITIPTIRQKIDSLNVSVAFGIILSQFR